MAPDHSALDAALGELKELYAALDEQISALSFKCRRDGDCCRFSRSGLCLYITWLEARYLFGSVGDLQAGDDCALHEGDDCAFQDGNICVRRDQRALGCRVYGCDRAYEAESAAIYETFHAQIGAIHEKHGLPYEYRDIRDWARIFSRPRS